MKYILVPTDFSDNSLKALSYAANLARVTDRGIVLLNCFDMPAGNSHMMMDLSERMRKDAENELKDTLTKMSSDLSGLDVKTMAHYGPLDDGVKISSKTYSVDLIAMGTKGASNLASRIFGSNTLQIMKIIDLPLLAIPENTVWEKWEDIVLAMDLQDKNHKSHLKTIKGVLNNPATALHILHVNTSVEDNMDKTGIASDLSAQLGDQKHDVIYHLAESVSDGIIDFIEHNECDLLVLIKRKYSFLERLLRSSVTKSLALHGSKPMLLVKQED